MRINSSDLIFSSLSSLAGWCGSRRRNPIGAEVSAPIPLPELLISAPVSLTEPLVSCAQPTVNTWPQHEHLSFCLLDFHQQTPLHVNVLTGLGELNFLWILILMIAMFIPFRLYRNTFGGPSFSASHLSCHSASHTAPFGFLSPSNQVLIFWFWIFWDFTSLICLTSAETVSLPWYGVKCPSGNILKLSNWLIQGLFCAYNFV